MRIIVTKGSLKLTALLFWSVYGVFRYGFIGVGLAADAFAAAVVRGLRIGRLRAACLASTALTFAFFQGAMTLAAK